LKKLWTAFVACFKLGMFSLAVLKEISKLITGPFFLAHCHRSMFHYQWSCFLKNLRPLLCAETLQWQWPSDSPSVWLSALTGWTSLPLFSCPELKIQWHDKNGLKFILL
jgi:hypothetical protein